MSIQNKLTKDRISIIVPVYNTESFLRQSLDSLINQTYRNLEIICINDGSSDNSLQIIREYAEKDPRIVIIDKKNEGVAAARNDAIAIASGEYLMFVDGDDWSELDACQTLIDIMHEYSPDVVMYSYYREYENKTLKKHIYSEDLIVFSETQCRQLHRRHAGIIGNELREPQNADAICALWSKMFKTKFFLENNIKYVDNKIIGTYGDGLVNLNYYEFVHKAVYINKCLYHYRKYNATSVTTLYKKNYVRQWNNLYDIIQKYIDEHHCGADFQEGLNNRIALGSIGLGLNELHSSKNVTGIINGIGDILKEKRYHEAVKKLDISKMPIHWKVFFLCCKMKFSLGVYFLLVTISKLKKII